MADVTYQSNQNVKLGQLIISIDGKLHAYATSAKLTLNTDLIDTSNKFDGSWASKLAGKKSWSISSDAFLTEQKDTLSYNALLKAQIAGKPVAMEFGELKYTEDEKTGNLTAASIDKGKPYFTGNIIITSMDLSSDAGDLAKNSLQAEGAGPLVVNEPTGV